MKIMIMYHQFAPSYGGIENHILNLSTEMAKHGETVTVLTTNLANKTPMQLPALESMGEVEVVRFPAFMVNNIPVCPRCFLSKIPRDYDIMHIHSLRPNLFSLPFQLRKKYCPIVVTPHFHPYRLRISGFLHNSYIHTVGKMTLKRADALIALTEIEKQFYESQGAERVYEIPNGVSLEKHRIDKDRLMLFRKRQKPSSPTLLFVGRIVPYKGIENLIKALTLLRTEFPHIALHIVGAYTKYVHQLQYVVTQLGLRKNVQFHLNVPEDEMPYFYEFSDLVLHPSSYEAFGIVILEAWAHKKPIIVLRRGGMASVVAQGGGVLLDSLDTTVWRNAMSCLLNDSKHSRELGLQGYRLVLQKYEWNNVWMKTRNVYNTIIG